MTFKLQEKVLQILPLIRCRAEGEALLKFLTTSIKLDVTFTGYFNLLEHHQIARAVLRKGLVLSRFYKTTDRKSQQNDKGKVDSSQSQSTIACSSMSSIDEDAINSKSHKDINCILPFLDNYYIQLEERVRIVEESIHKHLLELQGITAVIKQFSQQNYAVYRELKAVNTNTNSEILPLAEKKRYIAIQESSICRKVEETLMTSAINAINTDSYPIPNDRESTSRNGKKRKFHIHDDVHK